jgi:hypothetical protein
VIDWKAREREMHGWWGITEAELAYRGNTLGELLERRHASALTVLAEELICMIDARRGK